MVASSSTTELGVVHGRLLSACSGGPRSSHPKQASMASRAAANGHSSGSSGTGPGARSCLPVFSAMAISRSSQEGLEADERNAALPKTLMGRGHRAVEIDAAAGVLDDGDLEPRLAGILRREADAEVEREAGDEDGVQLAFAQISEQAGRRCPVVLEQRRIGIDAAPKPLPHHQICTSGVEIAMKFRARGALHAMARPEHLDAVIKRDGLERLFARMVRRTGDM